MEVNGIGLPLSYYRLCYSVILHKQNQYTPHRVHSFDRCELDASECFESFSIWTAKAGEMVKSAALNLERCLAPALSYISGHYSMNQDPYYYRYNHNLLNPATISD